MKEQKRNMGSWRRWSVAGILGAVMIVSTGCVGTKPTEQAPEDKNEPVLIAKAETKEEDEVQLKETPVVVDYKAGAEDILAQYTEEGMSRFKLNFPDTFSMEYALKNIGKTMPNFEGKTVAGKEFSTKSLKGKPFVLNFSKTTCPVCEEMSPIIKDFGVSESIPVVSLYPVDKTAEVETFLKKSKADESTIALVADTNAWLKGLAVNTLNIAQVPTLIFVDENGRISYTYIGKTDEVLLKDMKAKAFSEEKLYDFVKTEVVKVDADGNEIKEAIVTSEPLVTEPDEPVKKPIEKPIAKEAVKAKESATPKVPATPKETVTSDKK